MRLSLDNQKVHFGKCLLTGTIEAEASMFDDRTEIEVREFLPDNIPADLRGQEVNPAQGAVSRRKRIKARRKLARRLAAKSEAGFGLVRWEMHNLDKLHAEYHRRSQPYA